MQQCDKRFGQYIRSIRKTKKLTQSDLAEKCNCSEKYLGAIEQGKKLPSFSLLIRISYALETPIDNLLIYPPVISYTNHQIDKALTKKISLLEPAFLETLNGMVDNLLQLQNQVQMERDCFK